MMKKALLILVLLLISCEITAYAEYYSYPGPGVSAYTSTAFLPTYASDGTLAVVGTGSGTYTLYTFKSSVPAWVAIGSTSPSGTLPVANGGTGVTSLTGYGALVMNSAGTQVTSVAPGASGNVLTSNGTSWASSASGSSGANTTLSNLGTTSINADLLPSGASAHQLGNNTLPWKYVATGAGIANGGFFFSAGSGVSVSGIWATSTSGGISFGSDVNNDVALTLSTTQTVQTYGITTLGASSTTPQHVLNTATAAASSCGGSILVGSAGCVQITINGTTHYIPYY